MSTSELEENVASEQIPIIQITENGIEGFEILCRLCANRSDHLIPIYSEEGMTNDLSNKMNLYLPVKVSEADTLPLQCCYQCASTVLTWHELVVASVEADRRLRDLQIEAEKHLEEQNAAMQQAVLEQQSETKSDSEDDRPAVTRADCLSPVRREDVLRSETTVRKRGRPAKSKTQRHSPKKDARTTDQTEIRTADEEIATTDGDWIKTEFILCEGDQNSFETECKLKEDIDKMESPEERNLSDESDLDSLDPEFDPGDFSNVKFHGCDNCSKKFQTLKDARKHAKTCRTDDKVLFKTEELDLEADFELNLGRKKSDKKMKRTYHCDYCPAVNQRNEDLKQHMMDAHPDKLDHFVEAKRQRRRSKIDQEAVNKAKVVVDARTYYHCSECGKNLHSPYTYIWHNRIHTGERPFVCDLCGKQFRVSQGLVRHLRETHAGIKNFPCDLCGRMFATRRNVEEHRRIHTNERPYICDLCGKAFKQKASLFVHNRSHNDSFPFRCSYCNQGFRTRPPLLVHVTRHTGEKPFACDVCGRCFRIKYELKRHRLIHSDDKPFSCADCGLSFRQKRYLRNHNKINHNRPTPSNRFRSEGETNREAYDCESDKEDFLSEPSGYAECQNHGSVIIQNVEYEPNARVRHETQEDSDKADNDKYEISKRIRRKKNEIIAKHFCDVCSKGFTRKYDMHKHRSRKHKNAPPESPAEDPKKAQSQRNVQLLERCKVTAADGKQWYQCETCRKLVRLPYNFVRHQTIHTGVREYFCHICGKSFRMSSGLNRHIKEFHCRIKKHACDVCGREFAAKASLSDHRNIHTDERPFVCDVCGKSFKQKACLHIHKMFHSSVFRFACSVCGKQFRRARDLKVHGWLHTGHRPYACGDCGSMFRLSQDLKRHRKIHSKTRDTRPPDTA